LHAKSKIIVLTGNALNILQGKERFIFDRK